MEVEQDCSFRFNLNPHPFSMKQLRDFLGILKPGDTFIKIDIHDGFYHLHVSPSSQHYLGCRDGTCLCSLKTAPIGFTLSPWWFKKLFSPLGLCTHPEKCVWHPSETLEFLTLSMERTPARERQQGRSDGKLLLKSAQSQRRRVGTRAIHRGLPMRSSSSGPLLIFFLNLRPLYEVLQHAPRTRPRGLCIGSRCVSK